MQRITTIIAKYFQALFTVTLCSICFILFWNWIFNCKNHNKQLQSRKKIFFKDRGQENCVQLCPNFCYWRYIYDHLKLLKIQIERLKVILQLPQEVSFSKIPYSDLAFDLWNHIHSYITATLLRIYCPSSWVCLSASYSVYYDKQLFSRLHSLH